MAFEFTETFRVDLPDVESHIAQFSEQEYQETHGLIVEIAAIHAGVTSNYNAYSAQALTEAVSSWFTPYAKPIIMNHDKTSEPIGRVIGAKMAQEEDGTPYIRIQAAITDPEAIKKVMDKRYLTGSVGGKVDEAVCNICNTDWAAPTEGRGLPCSHRRGKIYKGNLATLQMGKIDFKEYSFVNMPSDVLSGVRGINGISEMEEGWSNPTRFFVLDLSEEEVVECTESEGVHDILAEMKKKDAAPLYRELKGAFIEAQILNNSDEKGVKPCEKDTKDIEGIQNLSEETLMDEDKSTVEETTEDILEVLDGLNQEPASVSEAGEDTVEDLGDESDVEEGERAEGQEKNHSGDVDPETSQGAPKSREDEEDEVEVAEDTETESETDEVEEETSDEDVEATAQEEVSDEPAPEADLTESVEGELTVEELSARVESLEEENKRLRKALHRTLAERVVDAKIAVGQVPADDRTQAIEEHVTRTASSLADSLRDLATIPARKPAVAIGEMETTAQVVEQEPNVFTEDLEEQEQKEDPTAKVENLFVDVLMGRRTL